MELITTRIKGMEDVVPAESHKWQTVEKIAADTAVKIFTSRNDIFPVTLGRFFVRGLSISMSASANLLNPIAVERAAANAATIQSKRAGAMEYPFM